MTWIKICGTTNLEDAQLAVEAGADALGFIFAPSPRRITPAQAAEIIRVLPPAVEKVGVFVNESAARLREVARETGITSIQLHGNESANFIDGIDLEIRHRLIKTLAASVDLRNALSELRTANPVETILLDSSSLHQRGGTGQAFDWRSTAAIVAEHADRRWIIAGGLTAENVGEAIRLFRPWGVDVVSGVEAKPGKKDPQKLHAFIRAVREADKSLL